MATRAQIIAEIWSGNGFPAAGATAVATGVSSPLSSDSDNLASVDAYTIVMTNNAGTEIETNTTTVWHPTSDNGRLAIYATGHTASFNVANSGHGETIRALIDAGYTVIGVHMPFASASNGAQSVSNHNSLPARTASLNYLRFFVEPAIRSINQIDASAFSRVCFAGLSGGGWQSALLAAIDTRIDRAVGVAGSLPLVITEGSRDWEQLLPGLNSNLGVDYDDLYLLCCSGDRKYMQVLNTRDSCCFYASQYHNKPYRMQLKTATNDQYDMVFDSSHTSHRISDAMVSQIVAFFAS